MSRSDLGHILPSQIKIVTSESPAWYLDIKKILKIILRTFEIWIQHLFKKTELLLSREEDLLKTAKYFSV